MNRRHLLKGAGVIALYSSFPAILSEFISSCNTTEKKSRVGFFSDEEFQTLEQVTEILLPQTSTPGAMDMQLPVFVEDVVKNCMSENDQQLIKKGLAQLNDQKFLSLSKQQKQEDVTKMDAAAFKGDVDKAWYRIVKKLALIGYFTSQEGMTKALNYVKVPGDYQACIQYKQGEKGLAKTFLMY